MAERKPWDEEPEPADWENSADDRRRDDGLVPRIIRRPLASRWSRLGASMVDGIIGAICILPGLVCMLIASVRLDDAKQSNPATADVGLMLAGLGLLVVLGLGLAIYQAVILTYHGQSIGKRTLSIRIVKYDDDSNPGFVGAVLLRSIVPGLIGSLPYIGGLFSLIDILCIFGEERRCLHDMIASTKVVNA